MHWESAGNDTSRWNAKKSEIRHSFHTFFSQSWSKKSLNISDTRVNNFPELVYRRKCEILYCFQFLTQLWHKCEHVSTATFHMTYLISASTLVHAPWSDLVFICVEQVGSWLSGPGCSLVLLCACSCLMICFMLWVPVLPSGSTCLVLVPWFLWPRPHATRCHCYCLPGRWLQCNMWVDFATVVDLLWPSLACQLSASG